MVETEDNDLIKRLDPLVNALKPHYYHTDQWELDGGNLTPARVYKRTRRNLYVPDQKFCPISLDRLNGTRTTYVNYGGGNNEQIVDLNYAQFEQPTKKLDNFWNGETVFQLRADKQTVRARGRQPPKT